MDIIEGPVTAEPVKGPIQPHSQPVEALAGNVQTLDDAAVRQAIADAEAKGIDPMTLTIGEAPQAQAPAPAPTEPAKAEVAKPEVPQKFLKPDGEVDVEKLAASTRQLDEAIQKKEFELQKTADDYVREYREKEAQFRNMPNPQKLAEGLKQTQPPVPAPTETPVPLDQLRARIAQDMQRDMVGTVTDLIDIVVQQRIGQTIKPIEQDIEATRREREDNQIRKNIAELAAKDSRVLSAPVFEAIKAKLATEPELWKLKNPHKAAWLEVKEELRLGEPSSAQAQPSRGLSPVLGGGTPPSAPSSAAPTNQNILASLDKLDLRDRKQEALGDAAIREFLARSNRW